ncbi:MAG: sodium:calcium antiporter [Firmicutes bacterium]|nr:sodium:calcium antiporter [Bacillota bacterium]
MLYLGYVVLAALVVILSVKLSGYVDALDKKTNLSGAFIGGVLLAAVTSLPELFTSITSVLLLDSHELVQGNVFGSNTFNLTIAGAAVLFAAGAFKEAKLSKSHITTCLCCLAMYAVCLAGLYTEDYQILSISWASILIVIIYMINLKLVKGDDSAENDGEDDLDLTVKQVVVRFVISAVLLVVVSIFLTNVTDRIAEELELGKTVAGAIFLGVATSLPELTSSVNLIRLKNFNASYGNVIGSNLFNFTILSFGDILYRSGTIYEPGKSALLMIIFGIVSTVLTAMTLFTKKNVVLTRIVGFLIVMSYVASIAMSM